MANRLMKIYHADDNEQGTKYRNFVEALLRYFDLERTVRPELPSQEITDVEKSIEKLETYLLYRPSASRYDEHEHHFDDVINYIKSVSHLPDVIVVDMRWKDETEDKHVKNDAGITILNHIYDRNQKVNVYTNTAFPNETIQHVTEATRKYQIGTIPPNNVYKGIKEKFPAAFRRAARRYLERATPEEKADILRLINRPKISQQELLETVILIDDKSWRIKNLFLCCWDPVTAQFVDIRRTIKNLLITDLTLAFSRAFGIWGLKAITHDNNKYFTDDPNKITKRAQKQLLKLRKELSDTTTDVICKSLQKSLSNFSVPTSSVSFDRQLRNKRQECFQFQGETGSDGISGRIANVLNRAASSQDVDLSPFKLPDASWTESSIELHLPAHEYFRDQFETLFESIKRKAGEDKAEVTFWNYETDKTEYCEGFKAKVHKNCIIIRNEGKAFERDSITGEDPATVVNCFPSANFGAFGKFYLGASSDGTEPCELFDCTFSPATEVEVEKVFAESSKLQEQLMSPARYLTYYLFVFSCWRPQPKCKP